MDNFDLNFSKEEFKKFYEEKDYINALKVAENIASNAPDSVYGWYYISVVKTENFTKNFDDEDTRKALDKFFELAPYDVAQKYRKFESNAKKVEKLKSETKSETPVKKEKKPCKAFAFLKKPFTFVLALLCIIFCFSVFIPAKKSDDLNPVSYYQTDYWQRTNTGNIYDAFIVYLKFNEIDHTAQPLGSVWVNFGKSEAKDDNSKTFIISVCQGEKGSYFTSEVNGGGEYPIYDTYEKANTFYKLYDLDSASAEYCYLQFFFKESAVINEIVFLDVNGEKIPATVTCAGPNSKPLSTPDAMMTASKYAYKKALAQRVVDESYKFDLSKINGDTYNEKTSLSNYDKNALSVFYKIFSGAGESDISSSSLALQFISLGALIFGGGSLGVKFMSVISVVVGAVFIYLVARKILKKEVFSAISSFVFLAGNFLLLTFATPVVIPFILTSFAISAYFMYGFFESSEDKDKTDIKNIALSGVFSSIAVASSVYSLIGAILVGTLFAFGVKKRLVNKTFTEKVKKSLVIKLITFFVSFAVCAAVLSLICYLIPRI